MRITRLITLGMALLLAVAMNAQDLKTSEVPKSFTEGLLKVYPNATDIEWEKNGTDYKVEFEVDHMDHEIWFNKDGERVRVEQHVVKSALPKNIADILKTDYADFTIDSVKKTDNAGLITYEVELEKSGSEDQKILFGLDGEILSRTKD